MQVLDQQHIAELLEELPEVQRRRLLLYAEGKSLREIARMECVDHKVNNPMKVITGPDTRWSYANVWEAKSINGGTPKFSVSLIIPKSDTVTIAKIKAAIEAAYKEGEAKLKGNGRSVPALSVLKTPLRDGDTERADDEAYANAYFVNANSTTAPGIVDADRQPILDRSEVYSGVYGRASIQESDLQNAVVKAINDVLGGKEVFLPILEENIEAVIGGSVDDEIAKIDRRLAEQQKKLLKLANAKKDYSKVADEIDRLREERQDILMREADRDGRRQRIEEMKAFLQEQADTPLEYDEQLVRRLVEKVTVYESKAVVEFKSGLETDVEL